MGELCLHRQNTLGLLHLAKVSKKSEKRTIVFSFRMIDRIYVLCNKVDLSKIFGADAKDYLHLNRIPHLPLP